MRDSLPGARRVEQIMGLPILVDVRDDVQEAAFEDVFAWLRHVDATYSTYRADSPISRIARGELSPDDASPEVRRVLARCEELQSETDGFFDAFHSGTLDPSGLVKGWAIDRAAELLESAGLRNFAINAGGDIRLLGRALPDSAWRVGIQHPLERGEVVAVVTGDDLAIATSGTYARGEHIVDPHRGLPPDRILSVTVTGPLLGTADAYATAAFAMGPHRAPEWTAGLRGYEAMTILADGGVFFTRGFPRAEAYAAASSSAA
jgi:thiamine biosynthesis lipoprotein